MLRARWWRGRVYWSFHTMLPGRKALCVAENVLDGQKGSLKLAAISVFLFLMWLCGWLLGSAVVLRPLLHFGPVSQWVDNFCVILVLFVLSTEALVRAAIPRDLVKVLGVKVRRSFTLDMCFLYRVTMNCVIHVISHIFSSLIVQRIFLQRKSL